MNLITYLKQCSNGLDKEDLLVIGFHYILLCVMVVAMVLDALIGNYIDAYIEAGFTVMILISIVYYRQTGTMEAGRAFVLLLSTIGSYIFLYTNHFGVSVYHIIIPLGYFLLVSFQKALFYTLTHQIIVVTMYLHAYFTFSDIENFPNSAQLVSIGIASFLIVMFGIIYHLAVDESFRKLQTANRQKGILLKEVHHRVKNNLNIISSMLGMQMLREKDSRVKQVFRKNRLRIDTIATVHEILYKYDDLETIHMQKYLKKLSAVATELSDDIEVVIHSNIVLMPFDMALSIGIISNELILNSIKYAFINNAKSITIGLYEEQKIYRYTYSDSGSSHTENPGQKRGRNLGFRLISLMVEDLQAQMHRCTKNGFSYTIRIPKNET